MPPDAGDKIGPYAIIRELGRGGMGVVFVGRDTRLDRDVAIKALPEQLAQDPDRLARFEREAKTLAQLNHPNIAGIYGLEMLENANYLVLEYVEGETLAARLDRGVLPVDEALDIAVQIAAGIEAAHEAGIIHRDLKPGNVIITPEGNAKVLDFGLARSEEASSSAVNMSPDSPTITTPHSPTMPGVILGTAAYMSPEQARGRRVDKRTDIWSFGVILYEMLTGASPFVGETVSDSIGAVLHKDIDLDRLPPLTPPIVRHVLRRCLARDKSTRIRDIGDARIEIMRSGSPDERDGVIPIKARTNWLPWGLTLLLLLIASGTSLIAWRSQDRAPRPMIRSTISPPKDAILVVTGDLAGPAVLARDGSKIAFVAKQNDEEQRLFIRSLDSDEYQSVVGTNGATFPFWSWNGQSVGYFAHGELRRYDLTTRTNRLICKAAAGRGGAWLADDRIVFAAGFQSPISSVSADGGVPAPVTTMDPNRHTSHRWPSATPDGSRFIYIAVSHQTGRLAESAIFLHVTDGPDIEVTRSQFPGQIVGGSLLVLRDDTLYASPFDDATGTLSDASAPIAEHVLGDMTTWHASYSASSNGTLVFHRSNRDPVAGDEKFGGPTTFGESMRTTMLIRDGRPIRIIADGVAQNTTSISPSYEYLAISGAPDGISSRSRFDIWVYRFASYKPSSEDPAYEETQDPSPFDDPPRRLTFLPGTEVSPQWSPDGEWIAFGYLGDAGDGSQKGGLLRVRTNGGQPEPLVELTESGNGRAIVPSDWSADGRYIVYTEGSWLSVGVNDIRAFDLQTKQTLTLVESDKDDEDGQISPDGRWLAYHSNDSGEWDVYVVPFMPGWEKERAQGLPIPSDSARWRVSLAGGKQPRWRPNGGELYFIAASDSLIAVNYESDGPIFNHDAGTALFKARNEDGVQYDVSADGGRFAFNGMIEDRWTTISLLTNWQQLLAK